MAAPTEYQWVITSTNYDSNPEHPRWLRFDGVDDYLNLPYMGLYANGSASVVAGVSMRKVVSAAVNEYLLIERNSTSVNPLYLLQRRYSSGGGLSSFIRNDTGVSVVDEPQIAFTGSDANVVSTIDNASSIRSMINGVIKSTTNYIRSGTLTLNNTTIGASVSTTTGNYASMKLYGLIVTRSALTDAQRIACERYTGRKAGVIL